MNSTQNLEALKYWDQIFDKTLRNYLGHQTLETGRTRRLNMTLINICWAVSEICFEINYS